MLLCERGFEAPVVYRGFVNLLIVWRLHSPHVPLLLQHHSSTLHFLFQLDERVESASTEPIHRDEYQFSDGVMAPALVPCL